MYTVDCTVYLEQYETKNDLFKIDLVLEIVRINFLNLDVYQMKNVHFNQMSKPFYIFLENKIIFMVHYRT